MSTNDASKTRTTTGVEKHWCIYEGLKNGAALASAAVTDNFGFVASIKLKTTKKLKDKSIY